MTELLRVGRTLLSDAFEFDFAPDFMGVDDAR